MDLIGTPLNLRPRYNVAPGQDVAAVRAADPGSGSGAGPGRGLAMLRWGLIPAWALCGIPHNAHDSNIVVMLSIVKTLQYFKKLTPDHIT